MIVYTIASRKGHEEINSACASSSLFINYLVYVTSTRVYKKVEGGNGRRTTIPSSSIIQVGRLLPDTLGTRVQDKAMRQVLNMPGAKRNVTTIGPLPRPVHV